MTSEIVRCRECQWWTRARSVYGEEAHGTGECGWLGTARSQVSIPAGPEEDGVYLTTPEDFGCTEGEKA